VRMQLRAYGSAEGPCGPVFIPRAEARGFYPVRLAGSCRLAQGRLCAASAAPDVRCRGMWSGAAKAKTPEILAPALVVVDGLNECRGFPHLPKAGRYGAPGDPG